MTLCQTTCIHYCLSHYLFGFVLSSTIPFYSSLLIPVLNGLSAHFSIHRSPGNTGELERGR